jgi:hypothetical protein
MPTITPDACRKLNVAEWVKPTGRKVVRNKTVVHELAWDSSKFPVTVPKEKCADWPRSVKGQYESARRAIRVFRWHHRPRLKNVAARLFSKELAKWKDDTMHWSSVTKMIAHPSYLRIIGLAREFKRRELEALILQELEIEPDHWFDALVAITGENPVQPQDDFDAAVNAWLEWGRRNGIVGIENNQPRRA